MASLQTRDIQSAPQPATFGAAGGFRLGSRAARILLAVGDHSVWTLERRLEASGAEVTALNIGRDLVATARASAPDVILLDLALSDADGVSVLRGLKKDSQTHAIPVVTLASEDDVDARVLSLEEGAVDCLSRPYSLTELTARLRAALRARAREELLRRRVSFLEELSASDPLTSLLNRRAFIDRLHLEMERCTRANEPLSCMMLDIDEFKGINDRYGHHVGDDVLRQIGKLLVEGRAEGDAVCRYGGEEFVWLLPGVDRGGLLERAEWLRRSMEDTEIPTTEGTFHITVSVGASTYVLAEHGRVSAHLVLAQADGALLEAKKLGKNRVIFREPVSPDSSDEGGDVPDLIEDPSEQWRGARAQSDAVGAPSEAQFDSWDAWGKGGEVHADLLVLLHSSVKVLIAALEAKDPETMTHCKRVAGLAVALAMELNLPPGEVERIKLASFLHDIGKLAIPEQILQKPGPLDDEEWKIIRRHPERGAAILQDAKPYSHLVDLILYHQESYDGSGYPDGLARGDIPLGARIIRVADSFDAMTSDRAYRPRKTLEQAKLELRQMAGVTLDPDVVAALLRLLETMTPVEMQLTLRSDITGAEAARV